MACVEYRYTCPSQSRIISPLTRAPPAVGCCRIDPPVIGPFRSSLLRLSSLNAAMYSDDASSSKLGEIRHQLPFRLLIRICSPPDLDHSLATSRIGQNGLYRILCFTRLAVKTHRLCTSQTHYRFGSAEYLTHHFSVVHSFPLPVFFTSLDIRGHTNSFLTSAATPLLPSHSTSGPPLPCRP